LFEAERREKRVTVFRRSVYLLTTNNILLAKLQKKSKISQGTWQFCYSVLQWRSYFQQVSLRVSPECIQDWKWRKT